MADKITKEDHNNTLNEEQQEEEIEIDVEIINLFRNGTETRASQDSHQPHNEPAVRFQHQDGFNNEDLTEDDVSSLMDESIFNNNDDFDEFPPDDFDGEMWNAESENLSFIKLPSTF